MYIQDWCTECEDYVEGDLVGGEYEMIFICNEGHETAVPYEEDYDSPTYDTDGILHLRQHYDTE